MKISRSTVYETVRLVYSGTVHVRAPENRSNLFGLLQLHGLRAEAESQGLGLVLDQPVHGLELVPGRVPFQFQTRLQLHLRLHSVPHFLQLVTQVRIPGLQFRAPVP